MTTTSYVAKPMLKEFAEMHDIKLDLIIPFYGCYEKIRQLMFQIWHTVKSNKYQIYLVDDCSPNRGFVYSFDKAPWTKVIRNETQLGFGGALTEGLKESKNDFIVFLHSDCYIEDYRWLTELLKSYLILRTQGVGLVSAKSNNPGEGADPRLKGDKYQGGQDIVIENGYLPLYCAICERSLFKKINGFIKPYPLGYYEDEELAYRMRRYGLKQGISGESWIGHEGGATFNTLFKKNPQIETIIESNRNQCIADIKALKNV